MNSISVKTPNNIPELVQCLGEATSQSKLIAGGTDYIISMHKSKQNCDMLIDLSGVKEIRGIRMEDKYIAIGAGTTFTEIHNNPDVRKSAACLAEAASMVGSTQIRNRATIAGNIANASPAADSIPPLLALNAEIELINSEGKVYTKPLAEQLAAGKSAVAGNEAIVNIRIPLLSEHHTSAFVKIGARSTVTISKISMAVVILHNDKNEITEARIALGAVGRTAYRPNGIEQELKGRKLTPELGDLLGELLSKEIEGSLKGRSSMPYKKQAIIGLAHDIFSKLLK